MYGQSVAFETLKGAVIHNIEIDNDNEFMIFRTSIGDFKMHHYQDCCESVVIEDICGDVEDLLNNPVLLAEEVSASDPKDFTPDMKTTYLLQGQQLPEIRESETWTFYKLSTIKGSVTIRWYGSSNGYYSESVDFEKI
jgi:hypothetical protein